MRALHLDETEAQNLAIAQAMIGAIERLDVEDVVGYFAADATWSSPPLPLIRGKSRIERGFGLLARNVRAYRYRDARWSAHGDVVFFERVETLCFGPLPVDLPVNSAIEFREGEIAALRDYYDSITFALGVVRGFFGLARGLFRAERGEPRVD